MRRLLLPLALLLAGAGLVVPAGPAAAHAFVVSTVPANGAELTTAPAQIRVTFSEVVALPSGARVAGVLDSAGQEAGDGSVALTDGGRTLVVGLRDGLAEDAYVASWTVLSADSHPVGGSVEFGYGVPAVALPAAAAPVPSGEWQLAVGVLKGVLYLALVAALGLVPAAGVLGADGAERRRLWRAARTGAAGAAIASLLQVPAQYLWDASALPEGATADGLAAFAGSEYAVVVYLRVLLLTAAAVAITARPSRTRWAVAGLLALAALGTVVHNGHGGTGPWWHFLLTLGHVVGVVAWLGGLAVLGLLVLRHRLPPERLRRLPLWSRYAAAAVALLTVTGLVQGVVQVRRPTALVETSYGGVLLVKLLLVAAALLLGLLGSRWIRRRLAEGVVAPGQTARLRRRVRAEAAIGAAVVVLSGVLSSLTPAEAAYAPHRVVVIAAGPYAVRIEVAPARRGPQSFRVTATGPTAATAVVRSIELDLDDGAVASLPVAFPYRLPGPVHPGRANDVTFVSSSVGVPAAGKWTGTLTLVVGPTEQYVAAFTYPVV